MAGTDKTRPNLTDTGGGPVIILVDPQLPDNIGAVARVMLNCGLRHLRLVRPREGWPHRDAIAAAAGAGEILDSAQIFATTKEAIADIHRVYATTARGRSMNKPVLTPRRTAAVLRQSIQRGQRCALLFGPERSGLVNDDIALADAAVMARLNPAYRSLNLAQAVFLMAYEWFCMASPPAPTGETDIDEGAHLATKADIIAFFEHLESALAERCFFRPPEKRPIMQRNIRNIFSRAGLLDHEVRTLRGIISALTRGAHRDV